jgi:hypothetical protein
VSFAIVGHDRDGPTTCPSAGPGGVARRVNDLNLAPVRNHEATYFLAVLVADDDDAGGDDVWMGQPGHRLDFPPKPLGRIPPG